MNVQITDQLTPAPFDPELNRAVLAISRTFVPEFRVSDHAPGNFRELKAHLDSGKPLVVASDGSGCTIFGAPKVNHAFRAWHDWCHWKGDFDFSLAGEMATCNMQLEHLQRSCANHPSLPTWRSWLIAEVIGQRRYYDRYKAYIVDQRAFVRAYVDCPDQALEQRW